LVKTFLFVEINTLSIKLVSIKKKKTFWIHSERS